MILFSYTGEQCGAGSRSTPRPCRDRPYDGHTLKTVIPEIEDLTGATLKRILADAGYRGHNAPGVYKLRVFTAGQKRRVRPAIKRQMKRRSAVEPVIGHIKNGHRMD